MGWFDWMFSAKKRPSELACVVCDSTDVEVLAPDAYRCGCGYEGGDGYGAWQRSQRQNRYRNLSVETLTEKAMDLLEDGRFRLSSVADIGAFQRGTAWGEVNITFGQTNSVSRMVAQEDEEERLRRAVERDVAGTFVHQQVLEAASVMEILIEKGEDHLALALEVSRASSPDIRRSGPALLEMGQLISG